MRVRLTGVPGSHPVLAVQLMLELKGIAYVRRDLPNQLQPLVLPRLGYPGRTVPVIRIDERRVQGSMQIARVLDELVPQPALFPADQTERARVEELEAWADGQLQETMRTLGKWAAKRDPSAIAPIAAASALPVPPGLLLATLPVIAPAFVKTMRTTRSQTRSALQALPAELDRVDAAIADGVIGGAAPNAADFQVATSVRLATLIDELQPLLAGRSATALAHRLVPDYPGNFSVPLGLG
jgi:glutathione S-transferase